MKKPRTRMNIHNTTLQSGVAFDLNSFSRQLLHWAYLSKSYSTIEDPHTQRLRDLYKRFPDEGHPQRIKEEALLETQRANFASFAALMRELNIEIVRLHQKIGAAQNCLLENYVENLDYATTETVVTE